MTTEHSVFKVWLTSHQGFSELQRAVGHRCASLLISVLKGKPLYKNASTPRHRTLLPATVKWQNSPQFTLLAADLSCFLCGSITALMAWQATLPDCTGAGVLWG